MKNQYLYKEESQARQDEINHNGAEKESLWYKKGLNGWK